MKPRRVTIMIEMETAVSLSDLRDKREWAGGLGIEDFWDAELLQVQANGVKPEKGGKK